MCSLWCHKECAGISDAFFKNLEQQKKEMGIAYWACRSCLSFAAKMQTQMKEVDRKLDRLQGEVMVNREGLAKTNGKIEKVERSVGAVGKKVEDVEKRMEENMYEEMRAREAIKRNIIMYGVVEPDGNIRTDRERIEADMAVCEDIFRAAKTTLRKPDIRFCRRVGDRGKECRPLLVGLKSEMLKTEVLDGARELQYTMFKNISIGPDQTRKQRQAEKRLEEVAERKNREELTQEDVAKNLKWMAVGRKGEKRIVKAQAREETWGEGPSGSQARGRGRPRGRGGWQAAGGEGPSGSQTRGRGRPRGRGGRQPERREESEVMQLDPEGGEEEEGVAEEGEEEEEGETGSQKRVRDEISGEEEEEEESSEPPRSRTRQ